MNRKSTTALCIAALLAVNAWILARLLKTEYTPFMGSIEGAYVGISRWMIAHGLHSAWFPLWYDGIPAQNSYPPLLHSLVAVWSWATGMTVAHSHHFVSGAFYCLAPVGLFLLTLRLSRSHWKSFIAGAFYSLVSPSAFLIASVRHDVGSAWGARKIQALIVYGEGPHVTSMALLFLALAAISAALEYELGWWTVAAITASSLVALTNWLGAMSLALGGVAMLLAGRKNRLGRLLLIGVLAYGLAMPWIPPSDLAAVRMNAQLVGGFPMGTPQYVYLVAWFAAAAVISLALRKIGMSEGVSFAILFLFFMSAPPLGYEWFHAYPLPQPDRYHLEMDGAIAIVAGLVLGSRRLLTGPAWKRMAIPALLCVLALLQVPRWRKQVRNSLPAFDVTKTVERAQALWLQSHFPGQRVFVQGSTRFWFNAFADNPQLGGGFDQGRTNRAIADVAFAVPYLKGNGADSVALLKAYGVRALAAGGKNSRDAYRDYTDAGKFSGVIPERWRDGDDVIYEIPGDGSLVHVVPAASLVTTGPLDWPAINQFAAAIDHSPLTAAKWDGTDRASIATRLGSDDALSVQISWDPGWRASVNGAELPIDRDKLGLMALRPSCENGCTIDLVYTGGTEAKVADIVFTISLLLCGFVAYRGRNNSLPPAPGMAPPSEYLYPSWFRALRAFLRWVYKKLPPWPIASSESQFDANRLRAAEAGIREMTPRDADSERYLARHIPRLSKTLALIPPPQKTGRVLELGCYMQITPLLERVCGYREVRGAYYGPPGRIDYKTYDFPGSQFSCYVDHFDVERHEFPYPDNYFDLVLATEIIEHMTHDPMWMLIESRRVLADGGYLLISTPNVGSVTSVAKTLQGRDNPQIFFKYERPNPDGKSEIGHVREYTTHELGEAVKAAGFEVERLFTTFIAEFLGHEQLLRFLALNGYSTENRGEQTWCLARKNAALPTDRYPSFLYEPSRPESPGPRVTLALTMRKASFDPGLTQQYGAPLRRALNKDGSFNVRRRGADWRAFHPWLAVIRVSWPAFTVLVFAFYLSVNTVFALSYFSIDASQIQGSAAHTELRRFMNDFFFSAHTLTTVGYGNLAPVGVRANVLAILEALTGLLGFAVVTGMLVARTSKPSASIGYSKNVLIAPYQEGKAAMFRVANQRSNNLMEMEAQVLLMTVGGPPDKPQRKFELLPLERDKILMFALTWTVVHPIDEASPFYGKTAEDLARMQAEMIVLIKGFDDTFSQIVHSRQSYRHDEFVWDAKFDTAFTVAPQGDLMLELDRLGDYSLTEKAAVARISREDDPARTSNSA